METQRKPIDPELNALSRIVVDSILCVHREVGPGLLESVYETCLLYELGSRNLCVQRQVHLPLIYRSVKLDTGLRIDLLVEKKLLVELKSVETILPVHHAQVLSYLKLADLRLGLLVNFNVALIKDGTHRLVR
jgi:GxxExxY protein